MKRPKKSRLDVRLQQPEPEETWNDNRSFGMVGEAIAFQVVQR